MYTLAWLVDDSLATRLTITLLHFLWQGCCIGLVVWLGGTLLSGASARLRYGLNVMCLLLMAACLPVTFALVESPAMVATTSSDSQLNDDARTPHSAMMNAAASDERDVSFVAELPRVDNVSGTAEPRAEIPEVTSNPKATEVSSTTSPSFFSSQVLLDALPRLSRWIAPLYLIGVASVLGRLMLGVWGAQRLRQRAIPIEDSVLLASFCKLAKRVGLRVAPTIAWCEQISIPVVVGIVRPIILLPTALMSSLTPDQWQALLLHELSHIRRYDPIINLLQRIVEALLFFHPVVWFVSCRISSERENAADDMVLAAGWDRPVYADALLRMAELTMSLSGRSDLNSAAILAASGNRPSEFKLRVLRLLDASAPPKFALSRTGILLVLSLMLASGVFAWSQTQPPAQGDVVKATDNSAKGLEFLKSYPALQALSLKTTENQFLEIVKEQKLTTNKTIDDDKVQHRLALGDGHTLIVMFDKSGEQCQGIQRVRGDDAASAVTTLRKPALLLPDHWIVMAVGFDNDGKELVTASTQSFVTIRRWDLVGQKLISEIKLESDQHGRTFYHETLALSDDRRRVIGATDAYVGIWETATGKLLQKMPIPKVGDNDTIQLLSCTPDLSVIVGCLGMKLSRTALSYDAHTVVWDGNTGKQLRILTHPGMNDFFAISLASDGKRFVTTNGGVSVWNTTTGKQLLEVPNDNTGRKHSDPEVTSDGTKNVWSVRFSPDGKQIAMGDMLGVKLVDATSGKLIRQLEGPYRYSSGLSPPLVFSQDGLLLARLGTSERITGKDAICVVPIWSTETGEKQFELHTEANNAAFSKDNQQLAVGFSDLQQALSVWSLKEGTGDVETAGPGPDSRIDKVEENGHYRGKTAAEFVDKFKPVWGEAQLGVQYGIALTKERQQYHRGERVPLVAFFRNASDKQIKIDMRPDYLGNMPKVTDAQGVVVQLENVAMVGHVAHYVEDLAPGEVVGPFYLSFGLGENPRPGKQHWQPYYKSPVVGKYQLTHTVSVGVRAKEGDEAKNVDVNTGTLAFEIEEDMPAAEGADK